MPPPYTLPRERGRAVRGSAVPAERLRLSGRALAETMLTRAGPRKFIASSRAPRMSFGSLTKKPLPPKAFHDAVITRAVDQRVGLHLEHRIFRNPRACGTDAAIVEHDDFDRQVVARQRLHLHARKADRRVSRKVDDRTVRGARWAAAIAWPRPRPIVP